MSTKAGNNNWKCEGLKSGVFKIRRLYFVKTIKMTLAKPSGEKKHIASFG
jgi:hypothetical protein